MQPIQQGNGLTDKRQEFARGWTIVLACILGVGVGVTGLPFYTFGIFVKPLAADFGWSRGAITTGMLCLNFGGMVTSPFIGKLMDRFGVRTLALTSLVGLAIGFLLLSRTGSSVATFYAGWLALSFLGCATSPLAWTRAVNLNFDKARGLALGLTLLGTGIASILGPPAVQALIARYGWRGAYVGIALFILLVALPIAFAFLREPVPETNRSRAEALIGAGYREAVTSRRFLLIGLGIFCVILAQASATVHLVPLLGDRGMSAGQAASIAGLLGVAVIIGRVLVGLLLDRFHAPKVARIFLALPALALLLLLSCHDAASAGGAALLLGLAAGAEVDLLAYLVSRYFGMLNYGAIYGTLLSIFTLGAGLGPVLTGLAYDSAKSYDLALAVGTALFLIGAAAIGFLGPYPSYSEPDR